jgi:hypothetical protein
LPPMRTELSDVYSNVLGPPSKKVDRFRLMFNHERPHENLQNEAAALVTRTAVEPYKRRREVSSVGISDLSTS